MVLTDDAILVAQAAAGNSSAFCELVERYRDAVCAIAYSYLGNFDDVQDIAQEAFVQAYTQLGSLREPAKFGPWLRRIINNLCAEAIRRDRNTSSLDDLEENAMPVSLDDPQRAASRIIVRDALAKLSEEKRVTTTLFYINGYSHAEVASFLEVPLATVRSRLQSAKRQLSKEMITLVKDVLNEEKKKVRITNRHVVQTELVEETGIEELDDFLYGLVNVLAISFRDDLRAIYLAKSLMTANFCPLYFIFKDEAFEKYGFDVCWKVWSIVDHIMCLSKYAYRIDPLYNGREQPVFDLTARQDMYPMTPMLRLLLREDSLLLWGEDIRPRVAQDSSEELRKDVIMPPFNHIKQRHYARPDGSSALGDMIVYPLSEPTMRREDPKDWTRCALMLARALICLQTGEFVFDQQKIAETYERIIGGPYADMVNTLSATRLGDVPKREWRKIQLDACRRMTGFENYFLEPYLQAESMYRNMWSNLSKYRARRSYSPGSVLICSTLLIFRANVVNKPAVAVVDLVEIDPNLHDVLAGPISIGPNRQIHIYPLVLAGIANMHRLGFSVSGVTVMNPIHSHVMACSVAVLWIHANVNLVVNTAKIVIRPTATVENRRVHIGIIAGLVAVKNAHAPPAASRLPESRE